MSSGRARGLAPALGVSALLGVLALALDHGLGLGLPRGALEAVGRVYFALLLGAPLLLYPLAFRAGLPRRARLALSLLPGFLWWLTELRVRLRWHALPEALWLAASPVNLAHLYLALLAALLADAGVRVAGRLRGRRELRPRRSRVVAAVAALVLGPALVLASIPAFLAGHRALFQRDLLGAAAALPGALPPGSVTPGGHPPNVVFILSNGQYNHLTLTSLDTSIRRYAETVTSLDREIGRVLDFLAAHGLAENTLVIYTSDNGYLWGEHGLGDKRWAYEESIRIPFLLRHPALRTRRRQHGGRARRERGRRADAARPRGARRARVHAGRSLLPLLADPNATHRDALLYSYTFEPPYPTPTLRAMVTPRHKYVAYDGLRPELFDLAADPREQRNLAGGADAPLEAALAQRLAALAAEAER